MSHILGKFAEDDAEPGEGIESEAADGDMLAGDGVETPMPPEEVRPVPRLGLAAREGSASKFQNKCCVPKMKRKRNENFVQLLQLERVHSDFEQS